jgi:hypothetical protein
MSCRELFFLLLILTVPLHGRTYLYTKTSSPYLITENVNISLDNGDTLLIEAGVEIIINSGISFIVQHNNPASVISMIGTETEPIIIRGIDENNYVHFNLQPSDPLEYINFISVKGRSDGFIIHSSCRDIDYLSFERCDYAVYMDSNYEGNIAWIRNCQFMHMDDNLILNFDRTSSIGADVLLFYRNRFYQCSAQLISTYDWTNAADESYSAFIGNEIVQCENGFVIPSMRVILVANNLFRNNVSFHMQSFGSDNTYVFYNNVFFSNPTTTTLLELMGSQVYIANSIFWQNSTGINPLMWLNSSMPGMEFPNSIVDIRNCIIPGLMDNIELPSDVLLYSSNLYEFDPLFDFTPDSSFNLLPESPAIDAGLDNPFMNDRDGSRNDLGIHGGNDFFVFPASLNLGKITLGDSSGEGQGYLNFFNSNIDHSISLSQWDWQNGNDFILKNAQTPLTIPPLGFCRQEIQCISGQSGLVSDSLIISGITGASCSSVTVNITANIGLTLSGGLRGHIGGSGQKYRVLNVVVAADDTLFIDPGTELTFEDNSTFNVQGVLLCGQIDAAPVLFSPMLFAKDNINLQFSNPFKRSIISNTIIEKFYAHNSTEIPFIRLFHNAYLEINQVQISRSNFQTFAQVEENAQLLIKDSKFRIVSLAQLISGEFDQTLIINTVFDGLSWANHPLIESNHYLYFVNNTFVDFIGSVGSPDDIIAFTPGLKIVRNNIFWPEEQNFQVLTYNALAAAGSYYLDYNIIKGGTNFLLANYDGTGYSGIISMYDNQDYTPTFIGGDPFNYQLQFASPGIDDGDPDLWYQDADGSRNDLGAYGGQRRIVPNCDYDAFWNLQPLNFVWLQTVMTTYAVDSMRIRILDGYTLQLEYEQAGDSLYPDIYKYNVNLNHTGKYLLFNDILSPLPVPFGNQVEIMVIDPVDYQNTNLTDLPVFLSRKGSAGSPVYPLLAWSTDHCSYTTRTDKKRGLENKAELWMRIDKNEETNRITYIDPAGKSLKYLSSRTTGYNGSLYLVAEYQGDGRYFITSEQDMKQQGDLPQNFLLLSNYPNPFNQSTILKIVIDREQIIDLNIYDTCGRKVCTLVNNRLMSAGIHYVDFNGQDLASGIYFCQMSGTNTIIHKIILLK